MPVNPAKEFLKSVHNEALFSHLFSRTLIEVRSMNFKAKNLRMVAPHDSKSDLPLYMFKTAPENWVPLLIAQSVLNAGIFVFKKQTLVILKCTYVLEFRYDSRMFFLQFILS